MLTSVSRAETHTASTRSSISAMLLTPHKPIVVLSSLRRISIAVARRPRRRRRGRKYRPGRSGSSGAERERAHDVLARTDAAIEQHLDLGADGFDNSRQHRDRRWRAVQLPAAVIGDHDRRRAGLGCGPGVLDVENALDDQLARPDAPDPFDILPVQRRDRTDAATQSASALTPARPSHGRRDCRTSSAFRGACRQTQPGLVAMSRRFRI